MNHAVLIADTLLEDQINIDCTNYCLKLDALFQELKQQIVMNFANTNFSLNVALATYNLFVQTYIL